MLSLASILVFALTRAEIIERMKAPIVTQADGMVQVFADCPEDMRREYQMPVARFAAETIGQMYKGLNERPRRFAHPGIIIRLGDVRTNVTDIVTRVSTNGTRVVTRIRLISPGFADLEQFRMEIMRGFYRCVVGSEVEVAEAQRIYRRADPRLRAADERLRLENWLKGNAESLDDEEALRLQRKVIEPGKASRRDVLIFASRLFLYPPQYGLKFANRYHVLSFREAIEFAKIDMNIRRVALQKADEVIVFGGGRGAGLSGSAEAYRKFLLELAKGELSEKELKDLLFEADEKLNVTLEGTVGQ